MKEQFRPQLELRSALQERHTALALLALHDIGVGMATWDEAPQKIQEIHDAIAAQTAEAQKNYNDELLWWQCNDVYYDDYGNNGYTYPVRLLGSGRVSLLQSGTPYEINGSVSPFDGLAYTRHELMQVDFPVKYLDVRLHNRATKPKRATVLVAQDTPAIAILGHNIDAADNVRNPPQTTYIRSHHEDGMAILNAIERTAGESAIEIISDEACLALASAIRVAQSNLVNYNNYHQKTL